MNDITKGGIIILDFGSQYTQLIARRIRERNVFSEILEPTVLLNEILKRNPSGIILSGGPSSVNDIDSPNVDYNILKSKIPIFGICYGLHILTKFHGGIVESSGKGEYGSEMIEVEQKNGLLEGISSPSKVWMSHGDKVEKIPQKWKILARSSNKIIAAISNHNQTHVATQFHPEVYHTTEGHTILDNFLFKIAKCKPNWTPNNFIKEKVKTIKKIVGKNKVLVGVSGGVDSTIVAALMHQAIGKRSKAILIDHGMMRFNESESCVKSLKYGLGVNIQLFDESKKFLRKLKGVVDPEKKRKVIGTQFIKSFESIASNLNDVIYLAQGTLYPDIIESGFNKGKNAHMIKSHHNVGGLPKNMQLKLIEPLKELFKDEVREIGKELGLPSGLINRHPFPGPGLGVRIIGEVTTKRIKILQQADKIYMDILKKEKLYDKIWQAFSVLVPVKTVGVMGDHRTYENLLALRAVTSTDGMTADWFQIPTEVLSKISNEIVNSVSGVNRIVYDITSKPPGTIEWE